MKEELISAEKNTVKKKTIKAWFNRIFPFFAVLAIVGMVLFYRYLDTTVITGVSILSADVNEVERGGIVYLDSQIEAGKNASRYEHLKKYFKAPSKEDIVSAAAEIGTIHWTSSDESIATVDQSGKVTTINKGAVEITVAIDEFTASKQFTVTVTPTEISAIPEIKFKKYKEQQSVENTVIPADADNVKFVFSSSDENVATVDENGVVAAVKAGKCTITTTLDGYDFVAETAVIVPEPAPVYPMTYSDDGVNITITKEKYAGSWVYGAHVQMSDYSRLGTACGNGKYGGGGETTSHAANRLGAILAINGDYASPNLHYPVVRSGQLCNSNGALWCPAVYSRNSGLLINAWETGGTPGYAGADLGSLVSSGAVTDTFSFGPPMLVNGTVTAGSGGGRAQRTFIGTSGAAGDIWLVVADGRKNDGVSAGLTYTECAQYLQSKGCTFGVPLDGGGSSTMVFKGKVLNAERGHERKVVDFVYVR